MPLVDVVADHPAVRGGRGRRRGGVRLADASPAVRLDPDRPAPPAGWGQVLDTMVERGRLSPAGRSGLTFPG